MAVAALPAFSAGRHPSGPDPGPVAEIEPGAQGAARGAGIAFHTAFAVFGAARLIDIRLDGWAAIVPWLAPAAIGVPAIVLWTRHYRRKFGETA